MNGSKAAPRRNLRNVLDLTLQWSILALLLGSWELFTRKQWVDPFFFGQPTGIYHVIVTWMREGTAVGPLWEQVTVTLEETVLSFIIGVLFGIVAGFLLGRSRWLSVIFAPYIRVINAIPRIVLAPLFIIWLGLGMASKVALGVTLVFFIVFYNVFQGVREVDRNLVNNARILGAAERHLVWHVQLPSALSWIISSLHTSFGFALVGAVVGEFLGATHGLGYLIAMAQGTFNTNAVFAAMIILSVTALVADWLVSALERRLIGWRPAAASERAA
ncbi:MAG TPA: ABC transporter permease [Symbiobacteriaceae bacterium]|jgi:NitT/TauT family transport system permease protein